MKQNIVDVSFSFEHTTLKGRLHLPEGDARAAVVLTGPCTSVKEQAPTAYARALAERGYAALAFDHRYYGESGGEPRQLENPFAKAADIGAAADVLRRDARTRGLPVYAVGICAGGGYMAAAVANGHGFVAFAGIAGYYSAPTRESIAAAQKQIERAQAAERRWRETGFAETIPAVAPDGGDVGMPMREAYEFYGTRRGAVPGYVNGFAVQSRAYTIPFSAMDAAAAIEIPTLMVHSEHALAPALARQFFATLRVPKQEVWLTSQGQIDFYDDPSLIAASADAVTSWFAA